MKLKKIILLIEIMKKSDGDFEKAFLALFP